MAALRVGTLRHTNVHRCNLLPLEDQKKENGMKTQGNFLKLGPFFHILWWALSENPVMADHP